MDKSAKAFLYRLKAMAAQKRDLTRTSEWIEEYTADPKDVSRPWSYKDHEYQPAILNDPRQTVMVRKCSQVGLSEIQVRMVLALLHQFPGSTAIYTLPTTSFARQFTRTRLDTVIEASELLRSSVPVSNDSSELKRVGSSFLYMRGSYGKNAAISVPADFLVNDEVDFSDQGVLSTFSSRLGHAEDGGVRRMFSTPTVNGYGISQGFDQTTKNWYMVRCERCAEWVRPLVIEDIVLPGWDDTLLKLEKDDLVNPKYDFKEAHVRCPACTAKVTQQNLANPVLRQWVAEHPDAERGGYQIQPFDVPRYNTPGKTLLALAEYAKKADWVNFEMGVPYEDAESSFVKEIMQANTTIAPVAPILGAATGCVLGMDVGKVSHIMIGKRVSEREIRLIHAERVRQTGDDALVHRVLELAQFYRVQKGVIDAGPDFSTVLKIIANSWHLRFFGCYYVRKPRAPLSDIDVDDVDQVINAGRTATLDRAAKLVNSGKVKFAVSPEFQTVREHLGHLKRVQSITSTGDATYNWVHTDGPDHYAHVLNYLLIADSLCTHAFKNLALPVLPMAGRVKVKTIEEPGAILSQM